MWGAALVALLAVAWLTACAGPTPAAPISLNGGQYTPLGGVQKNDHPTPGDVADPQAAGDARLNMPALVEFYADYWLICKSIQGTVSDLSQHFQGKVRFIHINIDAPESQPLLKTYNVRGTPTIVLIDRQGHVVANVPGWPGDQAVADALTKLAATP
jgi:thiol:disulfide interchange protein